MLPMFLALVSLVPFTPEWVELTGTDLVEPVMVSMEVAPEPEAIAQASVSRGMGSDTAQWLPLVAGHFEPEDVDRVLCLMEFESGGNPNARNRSSGAAGLMQVMPMWADEYGVSYQDLFTPEINLFIASKLRYAYGWTQWSPYKRGECH